MSSTNYLFQSTSNIPISSTVNQTMMLHIITILVFVALFLSFKMIPGQTYHILIVICIVTGILLLFHLLSFLKNPGLLKSIINTEWDISFLGRPEYIWVIIGSGIGILMTIISMIIILITFGYMVNNFGVSPVNISLSENYFKIMSRYKDLLIAAISITAFTSFLLFVDFLDDRIKNVLKNIFLFLLGLASLGTSIALIVYATLFLIIKIKNIDQSNNPYAV